MLSVTTAAFPSTKHTSSKNEERYNISICDSLHKIVTVLVPDNMYDKIIFNMQCAAHILK